MIKTTLIYLSVLLFLIPRVALAQDYPKPISSYINDFADLIDPETENRITKILTDLRKDTGIEITVVTIKSVQDYDSTQSVPDFTTGPDCVKTRLPTVQNGTSKMPLGFWARLNVWAGRTLGNGFYVRL